ncbi:hypothetical protein [Azospirillum soli]|uniref:hypothetical protein n=1 Tax=Azospirillum soli TaxID=1304799 RepID=UPI001AE113F9|nr:hypothetical protein [Azospirillum soli]MBP2315530.1 hypothetical protein [Azospirillum soli]
MLIATTTPGSNKRVLRFGYRVESADETSIEKYFSKPFFFRLPNNWDKPTDSSGFDIPNGGGWGGVWFYESLTDAVGKWTKFPRSWFLSRIDLQRIKPEKIQGFQIVPDGALGAHERGWIIVGTFSGAQKPSPGEGHLNCLTLPHDSVAVWDGSERWVPRSAKARDRIVHTLRREAYRVPGKAPPLTGRLLNRIGTLAGRLGIGK